MPLEADDQPAAGVRAGQPDGGADDLAAGVGEPDQLDPRYRLGDLAGRLDLQLIRQAEAGAELADSGRDGLGHGRVPVAQDHRAQPEQVVDVGMPVDVADPGAETLGQERGVRLPAELDGARAAAGAPGNVAAGLGEQLARTRCPGPVTLVEGPLVQGGGSRSLAGNAELGTILSMLCM